MRNLLRCPSCDAPIATIESIDKSMPPPRESEVGLLVAVSAWLAGEEWDGQIQNADLLRRYREATRDHVTSHRRWSQAMKRLGVRQKRTSGGSRVWVR